MFGPHRRLPWQASDPQEILVHTRYNAVKGDYRRSPKDAEPFLKRYNRAKYEFDVESAAAIVEECLNNQTLDRIIDRLLVANKPPLLVYPHPEFDPDEGLDPVTAPITNALPGTIAGRLAAELGCGVDGEIIQVSRPGRSKLKPMQRFLWQPAFRGEVRPDMAYILVDDMCTHGGTLAALRHHIVNNGGTVLAATTLANQDGGHVRFPIADETLGVLNGHYGPELNDLLRREVGYATNCLTELEGQALSKWHEENCRGTGPGPVQRLRNRFAKAKETGS